jgi:hypothetical protein
MHLRGLLKQAFHLSLMCRLLTLNLSPLFFRIWNRAPAPPPPASSTLPWLQKPPLSYSLRLGAQLFTGKLSWGSLGSYKCGLHSELRTSPVQAAPCVCTCRWGWYSWSTFYTNRSRDQCHVVPLAVPFHTWEDRTGSRELPEVPELANSIVRIWIQVCFLSSWGG